MGLEVGKKAERRFPTPGQGHTPTQADPGLSLDAAAWAAPRRIGRYVLGEPLGQGGMGKVFAAFDLVLKREVALKLLWRSDPGLVARFVQEAQFQARLDHPNICKVYEVEATGSTPFIAMQLVHGQGLLDRTLNLELEPLLELMIQCTQAVHAAHEAGMIHRDLKPGNILLEADGKGGWKPVLLDFGLAKERESPGLTVGPRVMGTPAFMSPEQALGVDVTVRSDVYSLGATFYAFLTGQSPFQADSAVELLLKQGRTRPQPLRRLSPEVPAPLARILHTCLERDPKRRYPSALALAEDLRRFQTGEPIQARRLIRPGRWLAAGALALTLLGAGIWVSCRSPRAPMSGLQGSLERPIRVLLLQGAPTAPNEAWMEIGLGWVAFDTLQGRKDLLPLMAAGSDAARTGPRDQRAVADLARKYGADLVILTSLRRAGSRLAVAVQTMRAAEGRLKPLLAHSFDPAQYLEAEEALRRALPSRLGVSDQGDPWPAPRHLETRRLALRAQLLISGDRDRLAEVKALELLDQAMAKEPDYVPPHGIRAGILYLQAADASYAGRIPELQKLLAEAGREAELTIRLAPTSPEGYIKLAPVQRLAGDLNGAERTALQALKLGPLSVPPQWLLATVDVKRPGAEAFQRAISHARTAVWLRPQDPVSCYRLAQLYLDAGQFRRATEAVEQSIALLPEQLYAHLIRCNSLLWSGRVAEGEVAVQEALKHYPNARLLQRNQVYTAYLTRDGAAFSARLASCREQWPPEHSTRQFLEGLDEAFHGQWARVRARYGAQLKFFREHRKTLPFTESTTASVDLYLMGRVLAQGPDRRAALPFVALSESYYTNRLRMAQRDPAFTGLWPEPEPWPGD